MVDFATSFLVSVVTSAGVVWFGRTVIGEWVQRSIEHEFQQKMEIHKAQLKAANAEAVERLKSELQIAAAERQIRFSRLNEKVAEVIAETYAALQAVLDALALYVAPLEFESMGTQEQRRKCLAESVAEFKKVFYPKKVYLPRELANQIQRYEGTLIDMTHKFMLNVEFEKHDVVKRGETWGAIGNQLVEEAHPLFYALEMEFQRLLGVEEGSRHRPESVSVAP